LVIDAVSLVFHLPQDLPAVPASTDSTHSLLFIRDAVTQINLDSIVYIDRTATAGMARRSTRH
jgi:hypothetical protein